ncbi:hypothetical protein GCM10020216_079600 [Nonomuraea helvata]
MFTGPLWPDSAAEVFWSLLHAPTPNAMTAAVASARSLRVRMVVLSM